VSAALLILPNFVLIVVGLALARRFATASERKSSAGKST